MGGQFEEWEDREAWEAEFEDAVGGSRHRLRTVLLVLVAVTLLLLVWYVWVVALLNPDNYRLPVTPTPPVTPWQEGAAVLSWAVPLHQGFDAT
jgi:NhaP-type Na+/H+ or K+/H+ antiporter